MGSDGYEVIGSKEVFKGEILSVRIDDVRTPSGRVVEREVITHGGAVGIVPIDHNKRLIMVRQYRHPVNSNLLEIPAGKLDPREEPEACATRELIEEIGMRPGRLTKLAVFYTTPGYSNELFHLYAAEDLAEEDSSETEEEILGVESVAVDEAVEMVRDGRIADGKTIAAVCLAKIYLKSG